LLPPRIRSRSFHLFCPFIIPMENTENTLSFKDTQTAFASKDDKALKKVSRPWLVKIAKHATDIALKLHLPIEGIVKKTIFSQFVGGETAQEADDNTDDLADYGIGTILDFSVEGKEDEEGFDRSLKEILKTVDISAQTVNVPFCVFKPSGVGPFGLWVKASAGLELNAKEMIQWKATLARIDSIAERAEAKGTPILIDAEETWMQDGADQMVELLMTRHNTKQAIIYHTLQMYRHDRLAYLKRLHERAEREGWILAVKLVRGAYMEKERDRAEERGYPDPIQKDKASTDRDFNAALEFCISHLDRIHFMCGTHNEDSSMRLVDLMHEKKIAPEDKRIYFAQLYGMSDHISYNLAASGYNVAKYVPYGPVREVMPYLIRRAQENTSAAGQTGRELSLIMQEMKRRKGN
jgi:proline dehydrogenase